MRRAIGFLLIDQGTKDEAVDFGVPSVYEGGNSSTGIRHGACIRPKGPPTKTLVAELRAWVKVKARRNLEQCFGKKNYSISETLRGPGRGRGGRGAQFSAAYQGWRELGPSLR